MTYDMQNDIKGVYFTEEQIAAKVKELGSKITEDYKGKNPLIIGVLKGSFVFMSDLIREIKIPCSLDFMVASSYGSRSKSSGEVKIIMDAGQPVDGRDVLLVEDILDSGITLANLSDILSMRGAKSVRKCALLSKPARRKVEVEADYLGFEIEDEFVVGYGLDFDERYRNLPYVGILKPEVYEGK